MKHQPFRFETAVLSDTGRIRTLNEDGVAVDPETGFAIVADGMGGHRAGDVASRIALDAISNALRCLPAGEKTQQQLSAAVAEANTAVCAAANKQATRTGMGTTVAMLAWSADRVVLAHVGDSRIYRLRGGRLALLTRDDSALNDQVELGLIAVEDVGDSHNRRVVTQALGTTPQIDVHVREDVVHAEDIYLLCSDGLSDLVGEDDIQIILDSLKTNLPLSAQHLVQLANDSGGFDNVSVVLVRVLDNTPVVKRSWLARLLGRDDR